MSSQNEETPSADKQDIQDDGNASGVVQNELVERQNLIFRILEAKAKNEALNYKFNFIDYKFKQSQQKLEQVDDKVDGLNADIAKLGHEVERRKIVLKDHKEKVQKIIKEQEALDESIKMYESKLNNISEIIEKKRQISQDLDVQFQVKKLQLETELRAALTELEQGEAALKAEQASYDAALCESKMLEMPMDQADKKSAVVKRLREKLAERKSKSAQLQSQFDNGKKINTTLAAAVQLTDAQVAEQEELSFEGARNIAALSDKRTNIKNRMKQVAQLAQDIDKNPGELAQLTNMDDFGKIQREQQQFQQLKATKKKQIEDELSKQEEIKQENAILQAEHVQHIQHLEGLKQSTGEVENRIIVKRQQADEKRKAIEAENEKLKMEIVEVKAKIGDRMASSNKKKQEQVAKIKKLKEKISDERLKSFAQEAAANGAEKKSNEDSEIDINNLSISMPMHNVSNAFSSSSDDD